MKAQYYILSIILLLSQLVGLKRVYSQTTCTNTHLTIETIVPQDISVCGGAAVFTVNIKNISSTASFKLNEVYPGMPDGMVYMASSVTSSSSISDGNISVINNPQFLFTNVTLAPGATVALQYSAKASCKLLNQQGSGGAVNNVAMVTYLSGSSVLCAEEDGGSGTYNVLFADLLTTITPADQSQIARIGDLKNRNLKIQNDGTAALSSLQLKVDYVSGNIFDHITNGGNTLSSFINNGTGVVLTLDLTANTQIIILGGDNDRLLEKDEYIELKEYSKLSYCNYSLPVAGTYQTDFTAVWGCNTDPLYTVCNIGQSESKVSAFINTSVSDPDLQTDLISNNKTSFCGGPAELVYGLSNQSSGTFASILYAKDILVDFNQQSGVSSLSNFRITNAAGTLNLPIAPSFDGYSVWALDLNGMFTTDPDGPGGLSDADGDGFYDDLQAGATLYIKTTIVLSCSSAITDYPSSYYFDFAYVYFNAQGNCNSFVYSTTQYFQYFSSTNSQNVSGPTDILEGSSGQYNFSIDRSSNNQNVNGSGQYYNGNNTGLIDCTQEHYYSVFTLPAGFKYVDGSASFNGQPLTASVSGNSVQVDGGGASGSYNIGIAIDCSINGLVPSGNIIWNMFKACNSCTSCTENIAQLSYTVDGHCNSCLGFHTNSFKAERYTFGKIEPTFANGYPGYHTDLTYAQAPSVNKNTPGVKLDAAYECDSVRLTAVGYLNQTGYTPDEVHVKISYTSPVYINLFEYAHADWTLISNGVTTVYPNTSFPAYTINGDQIVFDFKAPAIIASTIQAGDSLYLNANFAVTKSNQISLGQFLIPRFRASHYGLTGTTVNSCESFGTSFTIYKKKATVLFNYYQPYNCHGERAMGAGLLMQGGIGTSGDDFPNEYRPIGHMQDITLTLPYGFKWVPGSFSDYLINEQTWAGFVFYHVGDPVISGNTLHWSRTNPTNINSWPLLEKSWSPWSSLFTFSFLPDCSILPNSSIANYSPSVTTVATMTNYDYAPSACKEVASYNGFGGGYNGSLRNLQVSADVLQEGFISSVSWPVRVSNFGATGTAEYTWIKFAPKSNIHLTSATRNGQPLNIRSLGNNRFLVEVGTVNINELAEISLNASYTNCINDFVEDSIYLTVGSSCDAYPASWEAHDCYFAVVPSSPLQLKLRYKTANMSFDMTNSPSHSYNLCENMPFEFTLTSTQYANLHNVNFWMGNNNDITIVPGSVYYTHPYTGTSSDVWQSLTVAPSSVNGSGTLGWKLSGANGVIPTMNPEFQGSSVGAGFDKFKIKFEVAAGCSFNPGLLLNFLSSGITNCNDSLSFLKKKKIKISGFDEDSIGIVVTTSTFNPADNTSLVTIKLTNFELVASKLQHLKFTMPDKLTYVNNSASLTPSASTVNAGIGELDWQIPSIGAGSNYSLNFKIQLSDVNNNGILAQLTATASEDGTALCVATNTQCPITATTADTTLNLPLCYPIPAPDFNIFTVCAGKPVLTSKPSTLQITTPVPNALYEWDFNNDNIVDLYTGDVSAQYTFTTPGTYQVKLTARVAHCGAMSTTKPVTVKTFIMDATAGQICNGQPTTVSVTPSDLAPDDYVWYRNDTLLVGLQGPTQTVNKPGIYKVIIKSFSCITDPSIFNPPSPPVQESSFAASKSSRGFRLMAESLSPGSELNQIASYDIVILEKFCPLLGCGDCISPFVPQGGQTYVLSAWVKEDIATTSTIPVLNYPDPTIKMEFYILDASTQLPVLSSVQFTFSTIGDILESWQKIEGEFQPPVGTVGVKISLYANAQHDVYYDDIRVHPFNSNMKSFVFDPVTQRLMAELDENNYASYYEYDKEGKLVRVKKETERGVKTIQESRENLYKR